MKLPRTAVEKVNPPLFEKGGRSVDIFPAFRLKGDMVQSRSFPMESRAGKGRFTLNETQFHPPISIQSPLPPLHFLGKPEEFHERIIKTDCFLQIGHIVIEMGKADTDHPLPFLT